MTETARRPQGTGSISQRPNGSWMGQADFGYHERRRMRRTVYGRSRDEVEQRLATLLAFGWDGLNARAPSGSSRDDVMRAAEALATHTEAQWVAKRNAIGCCIYCGDTGPLTIDHATPVSRGGSNGIDNVVPACHPCNASKGNLTAAEFIRRRLTA